MCAFHSVNPAGHSDCRVLGSIGFNSSVITEPMFDKEHPRIVVILVSCQFS